MENYITTDNMANIIITTINTILENLFSSIDNNLYSILDDITFISSDILQESYFKNILGTTAENRNFNNCKFPTHRFFNIFFNKVFVITFLLYSVRIPIPISFKINNFWNCNELFLFYHKRNTRYYLKYNIVHQELRRRYF